MGKKIDAIVVRPMEKPRFMKVDASLDGYYKTIGCDCIQAVYPFEDPVAVICDDEGKFRQMPNRALKMDGKIYDVLFGTFIICGVGGSDFCSLPAELKDKYMKMFASPEMYMKNVDGRVLRIVMDGSEPTMVIA